MHRDLVPATGSEALGTADKPWASVRAATAQFDTFTLPDTIVADVTGDLTGNVTGDVTGDLTGNVTGNISGVVTHTGLRTLTQNVDAFVFNTAMSDANYVIMCTYEGGGVVMVSVYEGFTTTTEFRVRFRTHEGTTLTPSTISGSVHFIIYDSSGHLAVIQRLVLV